MKHLILCFLAVSLLSLLSCSSDNASQNNRAAASAVNFEELNFEQALAKATKGNLPLMIDVFSDG